MKNHWLDLYKINDLNEILVLFENYLRRNFLSVIWNNSDSLLRVKAYDFFANKDLILKRTYFAVVYKITKHIDPIIVDIYPVIINTIVQSNGKWCDQYIIHKHSDSADYKHFWP